MKNVLYIIGAFLLVAILWHFVAPLFGFVLHVAFKLALVALFAGAVYMVYKAMNREKLTL